jgi:hypothetical protein
VTTVTAEDLDKELEQLGNLAKDCLRGTHRWNILWERIDHLLEQRGRISLVSEEIRDEDDNDRSL